MPKQGATVTRQKKYRSQWLQNALKSVGISSSEVLKEMAPNIYDAASAGARSTQTVVNSIRRGRNGTNRVNTQLQNNKYVKYAATAYKNAMKDIRSGNFNNKERMEESFFNDSISGLDDLSDGFTFGDDGAENDVNINVVEGDSSGIANLSEQMSRQTEAQLKVSKANMDAYVAMNAASMHQMGQMGQEIIGHLSSINNNLISLVQFNNENMNRFIEASISYYDRVGTKMDTDYSEKKEKITAASVIKSTGGVNLSRYKDYVKQQIKESAKNSNAGFVASMIDDQMLDMLASNPLGFLSTGLVRAMVPKVLSTTVQSMETAFNNAVPNLLTEIADWTDDYTSGIKGNIKRAIGKAFGLKDGKVKSIGDIKIERGAIPFDGETKHAITEVITKELRDQTGYLEIIAKHLVPKTTRSGMRRNAEYWDWNSNAYVKGDTINKNIAENLVSSIVESFNSSAFGKSMNKLIEGQYNPDKPEDDSGQRIMQKAVDELFVQIERQDKKLSLEDLLSLIEASGSSPKVKTIISNYVKNMAQHDRASFDNLNSARLRSRGASDEMRNMMTEDSTNYHILSSSFAGSGTNADDVIDQVMGYGKYASNKGRTRRTRGVRDVDISPQNQNNSFRTIARNLGGRLGNFGNRIFSGDAIGAASQIGGAFVDQASVVIEKFVNSENGLIKQVKDNLSGIGNTIKDGFMSTIFGKRKDKNGKYVKEGEGILDKSLSFFKTGFDGWIDAIFDLNGTKEDRDKKKTELKKYFKDIAPDVATDATIGAGLGMVSGGFLGQLIGGPIGGAALGAATAFLKKNETFQSWLFGKKDKNGERTGGFISKATQKFFKDNKKTIGATALAGGALGTFTGGGILGTLVGGPIAGSLLGAATGIISKSETFKKFLYGDEKNGQKGLFNAIKDAFNHGLDGKRRGAGGANADTAELGKTAGMGIIGAGTGAITAAMLGKMGIIGAAMTPLGPIGGAIMGLGLSIKAQSGNFHKWLFGEKDGLDINGKKAKKQGVLGQLGNMINANLLRPFKTQLKYIAKDFMLTIKHDVLSPFSFAAEYIAGKAGDIATAVRSSVAGVFHGIGKGLKSTFVAAFAPAVKGFQKAMSGVTNLAYTTVRNMVSLPGNLIKLAFKSLDLKNKVKNSALYKYIWEPVTDLIHDTRKLIFKGIGQVFKLAFNGVKGIFKVATAPVRFVGGLAARGINKVSDKVREKLGEKINDRIDLSDTSFFGRFRNSLAQGKRDRFELKKDLAEQKRHDANAKFIAKYTKNQYSVDTDEAREYLRMINPKRYYELIGRSEGRGWKAGANGNTSITAERNKEKEDAEIAKNGRGLRGMTSDQLSRANVDTLNEEARQTYFLQGIFNIMRGKTWNGKSKKDLDKEGEGAELDYSERQKWQEEKKREIRERLEQTRARRKEKEDAENDIGQDLGGSSDHGDIRGYLRLSRERLKSYFRGDASQKGLLGRIGDEVSGSGRSMLNALKNSRTGRRILGFRASGGDINHDGSYVVGENGPEVVELEKGAHVVPNYKINSKEKQKAENEKKLKEARERGKTKAEFEQEEKEKKKEEQQAKIVRATEDNAKDTKEHKKNWLEIFGKKGLITTALIAGFFLLKSKIFPAISSMVSKVAEFIGSFGGSTLKQFLDGILNKERENGQSMAETAADQVEDIKDGNVLSFNEDGSVSNQTVARMRGLRSLLRATKYSAVKIPFAPKWLKNYQKGVEGVKGAYGGIKGFFAKRGANRTTRRVDALLANADDLSLDDLAKIADNEKKGVYNSFFSEKMYNLKEKGGAALSTFSSGREARAAEAALKNVDAGDAVALMGAAQDAGQASAKYADDLAKSGIAGKMVDKFSQKSEVVVSKLKNTKGGKLLDKVCGYIKEFFEMVLSKFSKKTGQKATVSILPEAVKPSKIISVLKGHWDDICVKIAEKLGVKGSVAAVSFGLSEAIFATLGAIDGVSGTAKLFHVDKKDVDGRMKLISGCMGGIAGTTVGGIIDLVLQLVYTVTNVDVLNGIATALYKVMSSEEDKIKLDDAQSAFHDAYIDYQSDEISTQYETQKKAGLIGKDVTLEQFQQGVNDGTYKVQYKSFADYNVDKNGSFSDKIMGGIGKGAAAVGRFFKGTKSYEDMNGNTYKENGKGGYDVFDSEGNNLGSIAKEALPQGVVEEKNGGVINKIGSGIKNIGKSAAGFMKTLISVPKAIFNGQKKIEENWNNTDVDFGAYISNDVNELPEDSPFRGLVSGFLNISKVISLPNLIMGSLFKRIGKSIGEGAQKIFGGVTDIGKSILDTHTTLFDYAKEGKVKEIIEYAPEDESTVSNVVNTAILGFTRPVFTAIGGFNSLKNIIKDLFGKVKESDTFKDVTAYVTELNTFTHNDKSMEDFDKVKMNGEDSSIAKAIVTPFIKKIMRVYVDVMRMIHWVGDKVSDIKDGAKEIYEDTKENVQEFASNAWNNVVDFGSKAKNWITGGGSGTNDSLNGSPYFSQNDPRWKNAGYNMGDDDATMGNAGCGPAAMAMVASDMTGKRINPMSMAALSKLTGNRDETGTNWNFINDAASTLGLRSRQAINPSAAYIDEQLNSGNPVVLSGASGGYGGKSPYTKAGHYIVAVGKDSKGNVIVNDPRGKGYSGKFNINDVANQTGSAWSFGGYGAVGENDPQFTNQRESSSMNSVDKAKWITIVRAVKSAIASQNVGYSQSNFITISIGGKSDKVRTDCSGFVSSCLRYFGVLKNGVNLTSTEFANKGNNYMTSSGFSPMAWPGWNGLSEGDIIAVSGHVEIFAYNKDNHHYVYNCGSNKSCNSANPTISGHDAYSTVWRPGKAGSGAVSATGGASVEGYSSSDGTFSGGGMSRGGESNATGSSGGNVWDRLKSFMGNFFSEFGSRAMSGLLTGDWSNTDYSNLLDNNDSGSASVDNTSITNNTDTAADGVANAVTAGLDTATKAIGLQPISGSGNTVKDLWMKFKSKGMPKAGIAAMFGNLDSESGIKANNLQDSGNRKLGISDEEYTTAVDNGSYTNFVNDNIGYGLAQWTSPGRKANLLNFAKSQNRSIGDPGMQSDFLYKELSEGYPKVFQGLMGATDVKSASDLFMTKFEAPKNQTEEAKAVRAGKGMNYLNTYGGLGDGKFKKIKLPNMKRRGGFGTSVDYSGISSTQSNVSSGQFRASQSAQNYVTAKTTSSVTELLYNAVQILAAIAGNTSESNEKLNALEALKSLTGSSTTNNNVIVGGTTNNLTTNNRVPNDYRSSYGDQTALKIAQGGF